MSSFAKAQRARRWLVVCRHGGAAGHLEVRGPEGRTFPWGDHPDSVKRRKATLNDEEQTKPVGYHAEVCSPYGALDMTGNVWQWCADWYDAHYYRNSPARNPTGPPTGTSRVLRGGRWFINRPNFFPATYRNSCLPRYWLGFCRFRSVMSSAPQ